MAVRSHMLHHALNRAGNGIGATTGERIAGVGGKGTNLAGGYPQACGARLQSTQHDAVARQDETT